LLAKAAYADLTGITYVDLVGFENALRSTGSEHMPSYAAKYLAKYFGVLNHRSDSGGYSGTLFARRSAANPDEPTADFTFALRGTDDVSDVLGSWPAVMLLGRPSASQLAEMSAQWDGLLSGAAGYELAPSVYAALQSADVNVTGHSLGGNLATYFSAVRPESLNHAFSSTASMSPADRVPIPVSKLSNFLGTAYPDVAQSFGDSRHGAGGHLH
jgi:hypothetical protein